MSGFEGSESSTAISNSGTSTQVLPVQGSSPIADLWNEALNSLPEEDKLNVQFDCSDRATILLEVIDLVKLKKQTCLEKRWKFKKGNKQIIVRDLLDKVVTWVDKFKEVADNAISYDPAHAALPWAGVRFFLQVAVNESQTFGAMMEGMEVISAVVTRYALFEDIYLRGTSRMQGPEYATAKDQFTQAILKLYTAVLQYLSSARRYYARNTVKRLARSIVQDSKSAVDGYMERISKRKAHVDDCASLFKALSLQDADHGVRRLETLMVQLDAPINRSASLLSDFSDFLQKNERKEMLQWLSSIPSREHHKAMGKDFLPKSGQWLLQKPEFIEWRNGSYSSTLWLHGIPGSGKSKLTYSVVECFHKERQINPAPTPLAHFYCARSTSEPERADPDHIMRNLLKQLSCSGTDLPSRVPVAEKYKTLKKEAEDDGCPEPAKLTVSECVEIILALLESNPATIVIDALDECDPARRHELIMALDMIVQGSANVVKIFLSSRDDEDIIRRLEKLPEVFIRASDNGEDIKRFVLSQVEESIKAGRFLGGTVSEALKGRVIETLTDRAQGMFRWVSLQIQNLCDHERIKLEGDVDVELGRLPGTLKESYSLIYGQITRTAPISRTIAKATMKWLMCALRPLRSSEVIAATSISCKERDMRLTIRQILNICCNLVVFDQELEQFRFAHLSVREYLEELDEYSQAEVHAYAAETCLDVYISSLCLPLTERIHPKSPIWGYSLHYWPFHYERAGSRQMAKELKDRVERFLFEGPEQAPAFKAWQLDLQDANPFDSWQQEVRNALWELDNTQSHFHPWDRSGGPIMQLMFACYFDVSWIIDHLSSLGFPAWGKDNKYQISALRVTIQRGYRTMCALLLERGADPNCSTRSGKTPLLFAVEGGHVATVKLLLDHGAEMESRNETKRTPLTVAARIGHVGVVELLLDRGAKLESKCSSGRTTLSWVAGQARPHNKIVQLLMARGAELETLDDMRRSPLAFAAVRCYNPEKVRLLLQNGANVESTCRCGMTPLMRAVARPDKDAGKLKILLEHGAKLESKDDTGRTALSHATALGCVSHVEFLLESGADLKSKCNAGRTPLSWSGDMQDKYLPIVRSVELLLKKGAHPNSKDKAGRTPLSWIASRIRRRSDLKAIKLLVERGARHDKKDRDGRTPLSWAVSSWRPNSAVIEYLLEKGARPDVEDMNGRTPLSWLTANPHAKPEMIKTLLEKGARSDSKDKNGRTPLSWAVCSPRPSLAVIEYLLAKGARPDVEDKNGRTPLSWLTANTFAKPEMIKTLLEKDARSDSKDKNGRTPLSWYMKGRYKYDEDILSLLSNGTEADAKL